MKKKGLSINVVAGLNMETSSISVSGSEVHIITDQEINALKLDDNHLKTAIKNKFINKSIVVASLHRSTQCDLHKQYNWPEVRVVYKASAEIIELTSEPVIIKEQTFKNNSKLNATFKVDINEALSNTCSSNWKTEGQLSIGQKFNYSISFLGNGGSGESSISYSQSFGIGGQHSRTFQIGSNTGIEIPLRPSESAKAILKSCKGFMKVRINFKVYLIGSAAVKFKSPYNNYDSWSININKVKCGEEIVKSTEDLEIGYYSNSCVEIVDNIS